MDSKIARSFARYGRGVLQVYFCLILTLSGCSSSIFKENDSRIVQLSQNNVFASGCAGVSLNSDALDVPTARNLVSCLNSHGAIPEYDTFVKSLSDEDLSAFLSVANNGFLKNRRRLKELDLSFEFLDQKGVFDPALKAMSSVLKNQAFISNLLTLVKKVAFESQDDGRRRLSLDLLKSIEALSPELNRENLQVALDLGQVAVRLNSLRELSKSLGPSFSGAQSDSLKLVTDGIWSYSLGAAKDSQSQLTSSLLSQLVNQNIFQAFDRYLSFHDSSLAEVDAQNARLGFFVDFLGHNNQPTTFLRDISFLFKMLDGPVNCLQNPQRIPNALMWVLDQITDSNRSIADVPNFMSKTNMVMLSVATSVCDFPVIQNQTLGSLVPVLFPLVSSGSATIAAEFLKSARTSENSTSRDLTKLTVNLLSRKETPKIGAFLRGLTDRKILADAVYLAYAFDPLRDRPHISNFAQLLQLNRETLGNRSVADVFIKQLSLLDDTEENRNLLYQTINSFADYLDDSHYQDELLAPLVTAARQALLYNNLNPVVDFLSEVGKNAQSYQNFFNALFIAAEKPEFRGVLTLTARMAQDGSLKDLIKSLLVMFRKSGQDIDVSQQTQSSVADAAMPPSERNRSSRNLPQNLKPPYVDITLDPQHLGCSTLNPDVLLSDLTSPGWDNEVRSIAACINNGSHQNYQDIVALFEYGLSNVMPDLNRGDSRPRSLASYLVDQLKRFIPANASDRVKAIQELGDVFIRNQVDFRNGMVFSQLLIQKGAAGISLVEELLKVAPRLMQDRSRLGVQKGMEWMGAVLGFDSAAKAIGYVARKAYESELPAREEDVVRLPLREEVAAALNQYEGSSSTPLNLRVDQVYKSYQDQIRNDRPLLHYSSNKALQDSIWEFFSILARPGAFEWMLSAFYKFDRNPYSASWWAGWYKRLSEHYVVIPYYYPGASKPTVRIVNDLDRLEIMVIDADFKMNDYSFPLNILPNNDQNFAIKFLSYLAASGRNLWPAIEAMERETAFYNGLRNDPLFGATLPAAVKNRLSNISATLPVMRELYGGRGGVPQDQVDANDIRVLADIFNTFLSSTPARYREVYHKDVHNLEAIVQLTRLGVLRNVGRIMQSVDPTSATARTTKLEKIVPIVQNMLDATLVYDNQRHPGLNSETVNLLNFLLRTEKGKTFVNAVVAQFADWVNSNAIDSNTQETNAELLKRSGLHSLRVMAYLNERAAAISSSPPESLGMTQALIRVLAPLIVNKSEILIQDLDLLEFVLLRGKIANVLERVAAETINQRQGAEMSDLSVLAVFSDSSVREMVRRGAASDLVNTLDHVFNYGASHDHLHKARMAWNELVLSPLYVSSGIEDILRRFLLWFEGYGSERTALARRTQSFLAESLSNGELMDLLQFGGCYPTYSESCARPNELYTQLSLLGNPQRVREIQDFLDLLNSAMGPTRNH